MGRLAVRSTSRALSDIYHRVLTLHRSVCLFRLQCHSKVAPKLHQIVLECQKDGDVIDLLDFEFFDDESLVTVYRHRDQGMLFLCRKVYDVHPNPRTSVARAR